MLGTLYMYNRIGFKPCISVKDSYVYDDFFLLYCLHIISENLFSYGDHKHKNLKNKKKGKHVGRSDSMQLASVISSHWHKICLECRYRPFFSALTKASSLEYIYSIYSSRKQKSQNIITILWTAPMKCRHNLNPQTAKLTGWKSINVWKSWLICSCSKTCFQ